MIIILAHTVVYSSGLAAANAIYTLLMPRVVAIGDCYSGCRGISQIYSRMSGAKLVSLNDLDSLEKGGMAWIESPINPTGEVVDIASYAEKVHSKQAYLIVDATFAPPPLQDPFVHGADIVLHSSSKYFSGHSDCLSGLILVKSEDQRRQLVHDRIYSGTILPSMESFLLIRSLRTFRLRLTRQSQNATQLVEFLNSIATDAQVRKNFGIKDGILDSVTHASLQMEEFVKKQMTGGYGATFSILMSNSNIARNLPSKLNYFIHATSLGAVESCIEWRCLTDILADKRLLRVSVGIESIEDLKADFIQAFKAL